MSAPWRLSGYVCGGSDVAIAYYPSENDPFHKLPGLKVLGAAYFHGEMSLALQETQVVENLLK
jgi:hypothetical protein